MLTLDATSPQEEGNCQVPTVWVVEQVLSNLVSVRDARCMSGQRSEPPSLDGHTESQKVGGMAGWLAGWTGWMAWHGMAWHDTGGGIIPRHLRVCACVEAVRPTTATACPLVPWPSVVVVVAMRCISRHVGLPLAPFSNNQKCACRRGRVECGGIRLARCTPRRRGR